MENFISLNCPSCGANIRISDDAQRYRCDYCGTEHILKDREVIRPKPIRPSMPVPNVVKVEKDGNSARIVQRWFSLKYVPMAFFCVAWDAFLCFWYSMAFTTGAPWIMIVFPIAHLAVGVGLTYSTLCGFLNRTVLEVTRDEVSIWFEPLPWLGEKTIKTADLKQLYCKEKVSSGKNGNSYTYQLMAVTQDNKEVKLLENLDSADIALFFEQQVETWLKIRDLPVVGEVK